MQRLQDEKEGYYLRVVNGFLKGLKWRSTESSWRGRVSQVNFAIFFNFRFHSSEFIYSHWTFM